MTRMAKVKGPLHTTGASLSTSTLQHIIQLLTVLPLGRGVLGSLPSSCHDSSWSVFKMP